MVCTPALVFGHLIPEEGSNTTNIVEMMRRFLYQITSRDKHARRGSVESCDEFIKEENTSSLCTETSMDSEEEEGMLQQDHMTRQIERCLSDAKGSSLLCQVLLLPRQMTSRVARDVLRSSEDEPCGLRGASIRVCLETKEALLHTLGTITPDPNLTPTFELTVVFKLDAGGWPPLKHIFVTDKVLRLRPEYRLVKKKLYSSASPVIHEFY